MDTNKKLKDAMLFNILSYMSNLLLSRGNTLAAIDELYLFLSNMTAIEYIRNGMKRDRKKDSSIAIASQNVEDFLIPAVKEYTKPLFSIPTHQFLFHAGQINAKEYMDALVEEIRKVFGISVSDDALKALLSAASADVSNLSGYENPKTKNAHDLALFAKRAKRSAGAMSGELTAKS